MRVVQVYGSLLLVIASIETRAAAFGELPQPERSGGAKNCKVSLRAVGMVDTSVVYGVPESGDASSRASYESTVLLPWRERGNAMGGSTSVSRARSEARQQAQFINSETLGVLEKRRDDRNAPIRR